MPTKPRLALATLLAYNELLRLNIGACPISSDTFLTPSGQSIIICSYQEFCERTGVTFDELSLGGRLGDGFYVSGTDTYRTMIFYNADRYTPRVRFTMLHEVGHVILNHKRNAPVEEAEANFFASQFLIPSALLLEIHRRGHNLDVHRISRIFDVSLTAARVKLEQLERLRHTQTHLDDSIVRRFTPYLDQYLPPEAASFSHALHFFGGVDNYRAYQKLEEGTLFP
ncbi:MAG: ImmA/IrrE family metallo-endopeptidase [Defluviitaleaceae bacterium]|nr:ImmA/IrrE family metallo-endopeptidase [Defluviitaleaceae bacterium]